jgi:FAD-dependent oxidoreductase domain-containing protein 1
LDGESLSSANSRRFDVVVIGAGITGLSTAYHIKECDHGLSVLLVDRNAAAAQGDSAKSNACLRDTFTSEVNRLLASSTINFYRHVQSEIGVDVKLEMVGYLWLMTVHQFKRFEAVEQGMREQGVGFKIFEREQLADLIPDLVLDPSSEQGKVIGLQPVHKAVQGLNCGTIAAELITKFYEDEFRRLGGEFQFGTEVKTLGMGAKNGLGLPGEPYIWQNAVFSGVETNRGLIKADTIVIATAARTPILLDPLGIDSLVKPKKRQLFKIRSSTLERLLFAKGFNEENTIPVTILPKGEIYFRTVRGEKSFQIGAADYLGRPFTFEEEPMAEESYFTYNIYPILAEYFPCFGNLRPTTSWAGLYDVNSVDSTPIVDKIGNCVIATGMSGSGIMKADAVGRMASALCQGRTEAELFGGKRIEISRLGLANRAVGKEEFVL